MKYDYFHHEMLGKNGEFVILDKGKAHIVYCFELTDKAEGPGGGIMNIRERYGAKSGDRSCNYYGDFGKRYGTWVDAPSIVQTKDNEFSLTITADRYDGGDIDQARVEKYILTVVSAIGIHNGFKYGVFDNIEERTRHRDTGTTTTTTGIGSGTGIQSTLYNSTYGVAFANNRLTTTTRTTGVQKSLDRKHSVRFYKDKPAGDDYFDLNLVLKSLDMDSFTVKEGYPRGAYPPDKLDLWI